MQTLTLLLDRLVEGGVDFVVIGGYAAVLHGSSQVTQDLDICAILTPEGVDRLRMVLADLDPRHRLTPQKISFIDVPAAGTPVKNLYLRTRIGVLDIITEVTGVGDYDRVRAKSQSVLLSGHTVQVIALEDLILAKQALGRGKDLITAAELRVIALRQGLSPPV